MQLLTEDYSIHVLRLPRTGRHIIAQYDEISVVVYQAYRPAIARFALEQGYFGGEFSLNRMSWIKPNFLWMMYRSGWGTKAGQEVILAIRIKRSAFDMLLAEAVHSSVVPEIYSSEAEWKQAVAQSSVRLQWDPDHHPSGAKLERRAIQLGLRGEILAQYARDWIVSIEDISPFVREQYPLAQAGNWAQLSVPSEAVYSIANLEIAKRLQLSTVEAIV